MTNIFAFGYVVDPHVRIEGKCRGCLGKGWAASGERCAGCQGTGQASGLVRLSELLPLNHAEYLGTAEEVGIEA